MEVLEFGCGTGSTAIGHAPDVKHIRAIKISLRMIEVAQGKADAGEVENVTFEQTTIDEFNVPDRTFDAVMGHCILHLPESRDDAISKVQKMLKPGGVFVSSTACIGDSMKVFKIIAPIGKFLGLLPLVKVFRKKELEDSLTAAGFEIDYQWQPGKDKAVLIVAKKVGKPRSTPLVTCTGARRSNTRTKFRCVGLYAAMPRTRTVRSLFMASSTLCRAQEITAALLPEAEVRVHLSFQGVRFQTETLPARALP